VSVFLFFVCFSFLILSLHSFFFCHLLLFPLAAGIELPLAAFLLAAFGWGDRFLPWRRRPALP